LDTENETLNTIFPPKKYILQRIYFIHIIVQKCRYKLREISSRFNGQVDLRRDRGGLEKGESDEQL
jgi:hypothetical protein